MKIYVASSWRNSRQPRIVIELRHDGHDVYDFRNPTPDTYGFSWSEIDTKWKSWTPEEYFNGLKHPLAEQGYKLDMDAMEWADACVLVMPCGRSAHLELGWFAGQGKRCCILHDSLDTVEPELMAKMCDEQFSSLVQMKQWLNSIIISEPYQEPERPSLGQFDRP